MSTLYVESRQVPTPTEQAIIKLEDELQDWLRQTPSFFHPEKAADKVPDRTFYNIPWIFQRQQRTIRGAYFFANMLLFRGYLLAETLHQSASTARSGPCSGRVKKCVDNAMAMISIASDFGANTCRYNATFWVRRRLQHCEAGERTELGIDFVSLHILRRLDTSRIP